MSSFDISRNIFDPSKHFSSVRMQQGKILTDSDWNDERQIEEEIVRRTMVDIIGRSGSPDNGFKITNLDTNSNFIDFEILDGTLYTGGIRFEMDAIEKFSLQKDWLQKKDGDYMVPALTAFVNGNTELYDLIYFEGWQQPVSAVEDQSLFEPALGGPDTTTRLRSMRRVKIFKNSGSPDCPVSWKELKTQWENLYGKINKEDELVSNTSLIVSFVNTGNVTDLCTPAVIGGYLGAENQAIRVQVTKYDRATRTGTFTWGFDNASPYYRVDIAANGTDITMITEPKDQYHWLIGGQVVEILPWSTVLPNNEKIAEQSGFLSKVATSYNHDTKKFTLATALPAGFGAEWLQRSDQGTLAGRKAFLYMRVWNRGSDLKSNAEIAFTAGQKVILGNTGLEITLNGDDFIAPDNATGNYWLIAARPSTRQRVDPWEFNSTGVKTHGVRFFYSPLAILRWTLINGEVVGKIIHDCRSRFNPLTEQECCCTYTVGDGFISHGDFQSIQEAVDNLPESGGKICILPGIHNAAVLIRERKQIHITGCGDQTIIRSDEKRKTRPLFRIENSQRIRIDNLRMVNFFGSGILVDDQEKLDSSSDLTIRDNSILTAGVAIAIYVLETAGDNNIKIQFNLVAMIDREAGLATVIVVADGVLIERNKVTVVYSPKENPDPPEFPTPPDNGTDPCLNLKELHEWSRKFGLIVERYFFFAREFKVTSKAKRYTARGGIQIGGGSERVWIYQNEIIGGSGTGILLGNDEKFDIPEDEFSHHGFLTGIRIEENRIEQMGIGGIGPAETRSYKSAKSVIVVKDIDIKGNHIHHCAMQVPEELSPATLAYGGIVLPFAENVKITENRIEDNGRDSADPICGIYIMYGEATDISNNYILNNGPLVEREKLKNGARGGIYIRQSYQPPVITRTTAQARIRIAPIVPRFTGSQAVKIHDNVVVQPLGNALYLVTLGPVSIVGNQMSTLAVYEERFKEVLPATVYIMNLGLSKDILNIRRAIGGSIVNLPVFDTGMVVVKKFGEYQLLPSGKVMFTGNQVMLDLTDPTRSSAFCSQLIVSLDDISFVNNQTECSSFVGPLNATELPPRDRVIYNTVLAGISLRANDNRFTEGNSVTQFSLLSHGAVNTCMSNQATHCLIVTAPSAYRIATNNLVINRSVCGPKAIKVAEKYSAYVKK